MFDVQPVGKKALLPRGAVPAQGLSDRRPHPDPPRCPAETKTGLTPGRVRRARPTSSSPSSMGAVSPRLGPGLVVDPVGELVAGGGELAACLRGVR